MTGRKASVSLREFGTVLVYAGVVGSVGAVALHQVRDTFFVLCEFTLGGARKASELHTVGFTHSDFTAYGKAPTVSLSLHQSPGRREVRLSVLAVSPRHPDTNQVLSPLQRP